MIDRILSSLAALSLALLVWLYARSRDQEILDNVTLPVQISLAQADADHYSLEVNGPAQAVVSFSGPAERIRELRGEVQRNELHVAVVVSIAGSAATSPLFRHGPHRNLARCRPRPASRRSSPQGRNRIPVTIRRLATQEMFVSFDSLQQAPPDSVVIEPKVVRHGAAGSVRRASFDPDRAVAAADAAGRRAGRRGPHRPCRPRAGAGRPARPGGHADGHRPAGRRACRPALRNVPIHFLCPPDFTLRPEFFNDRDSRVSLARPRAEAGRALRRSSPSST